MSMKRRTLGVYSSPAPLGIDGQRLCRNCHGPMSADKRKHNCSAKCSDEWMCKTRPSHMRWVLERRDKGICAVCGVDTIAQRAEYRKRVNEARRLTILGWSDLYAEEALVAERAPMVGE